MKISASFERLPLSPDGVAGFLSSHWVEGIGPAYARRLVDSFGTDAISVITSNPAVAGEASRAGLARMMAAAGSLERIPWPVSVLAFLFSCGLGDAMIERIFDHYKERTAEVVTSDPYRMVEDVRHVGFFSADKIGRRLEIVHDDPRRLRGALVASVKHFAEEGHLFATRAETITHAAAMTGVEAAKVEPQLAPLLDDKRLVMSHGGIYLPVFYKAEKEGARKLLALASAPTQPVKPDEIPVNFRRDRPYSDTQRRAIATMLHWPVTVLTGGPGSGKTTVIRGVIEVLTARGQKVVLAAPTGRAARRMTAMTGAEAMTIHRLLGYRQGEGYHNRRIDADALIIDEGSMMEQVLFDHLLDALRPGTRVILVGDVDQLPAIGAGDVLRDMIASGAIPVAQLDENFRQAHGSLIAAGASAIRDGLMPMTSDESDLMFISEPSPTRIHKRILTLMTRELPALRGISPRDIQVVTPQQIGPLGARQLNIDLQECINPTGPEIKRGNSVIRRGDPVMQTVNSSERGVSNGEVGRVVSVNTEEQCLTVAFSDGRTSTYRRNELDELSLAYATTVHKLQGSEIRNMIFPVTMAHKPMLYRNLVYTAVSRATDLCVIVGEEKALRHAVATTPATTRRSNFKHRLRGVAEDAAAECVDNPCSEEPHFINTK